MRKFMFLAGAGIVASVGSLVVAQAGGDGIDRERVQAGLLLESEDGSISLLDEETGEIVYTAPSGAVSLDRSRVVRAQPNGSGTKVSVVSSASGAIESTQEIEGRWDVRAISPEGGAVALMAPRSPWSGGALYAPEPRATTDIVVAYAADRAPMTLHLDGNFEPETFSSDASALFVLEYDPPTDPQRYFVRQIDIATGEVSDVSSPEAEISPDMRGHAVAQVVAPTADRLFTLYAISDGEEPVLDDHPDAAGEERWAFVHALDLDDESSVCIFLPPPFGTADDAAIDLALSPDGDWLFAYDGATGALARISVGGDHGHVHTTWSVQTASPGATIAARSVADNFIEVFLTFDNQLVRLDGPDAMPTQWWFTTSDEPIMDLEYAPETDTLRVALPHRVVVVSPSDGTELATYAGPPGGVGSFLGPPDDELQIAIPCAC